jgi:exonuclease III
MDMQNLLVWNVRGLNVNGHWNVVRELDATEQPSIICLQETKLHVIDDYFIMQLLDLGFDYAYLLAEQARGGILVTWHNTI